MIYLSYDSESYQEFSYVIFHFKINKDVFQTKIIKQTRERCLYRYKYKFLRFCTNLYIIYYITFYSQFSHLYKKLLNLHVTERANAK